MEHINSWSITSAILLGTILVSVFHLMICREKCSFRGGIFQYIVLLMLIFIRLFMPFEIKQVIVIPSTKVFTLFDSFFRSSITGDINNAKVLLIFWAAGSVVSFIKWFHHVRNAKANIRMIRSMALAIPKKYWSAATSVGIAPERIFLSKCIDEVVTVGAFNYYILLPGMTTRYCPNIAATIMP